MRTSLRAVALALVLVAGACGGGDSTETQSTNDTKAPASGKAVTVMAKWTGAELEAATKVMDAFTAKSGIEVKLEGVGDDLPTILSTRVEGGDPPDVAQLPQPGLLVDLAERNALKPLEDVVGDVITEQYAPVWKELGSHKGQLYGVWFKAANKSTVWYRPKVLADAKATPPKTWDEWVQQAGNLADAGTTPIAVGGADGWTLSDWFENVYLRTAGAEKYDQLAKHEIPWTDASVKTALRTLGQLIGKPEHVAKGLKGALQVGFEDSVKMVFGPDPEAAQVYEGDFVANTIRSETSAKPGTDFDFFPFPSINGSEPAIVGGGDVVVMFNDTPEARQLIQFLASAEAASVWAKLGGFTSPNKTVDLAVYPDEIARRAAKELTETETFRFDLSDTVPAAFGATKGAGIWGRLQDWLANPSSIDAVTSKLEAEAKAAASS